MSRRKGFDTGLSSSANPTGATTTNSSNTSRPNPNPKAASKVQRAPSISSPENAHAHTTEVVQVSQPVSTSGAPPEIDDSATCFICAESIQFWSVGVCGHRTCHVCAIRLRVFYKKKECTFCKTPTPSLLFSRSDSSPFPTENHRPPSDPNVIAARHADADKIEKEGKKWDEGLILPGTLELGSFPFSDEKLGVVFEDDDMMETTLLLLRFNCPYPDCAHMASDWNTLEKHTLSTHGLVLCGLCRRQLSRFAHEQVLYPPHLLPLHDPSQVKRGQRAIKPRGEKEIEMVKSWEAPHPMCEFCHIAFFGPDELFKHMRGSHEECFVCKNLGERDVYFQNYHKLEQHFNTEHFPCPDPGCLEQKFIVFPSDMDLRAHMVSEHGDKMSTRDRAQARHVNVDFNTVERGGRSNQHHHQSRGFTMQNSSIPTRDPGRNMRDNPPQAQQIVHATPMTGAQAAQHRRQVQTDRQEESRRKRNFDTGLTGGVDEDHSVGGVGGSNQASGYNTPREREEDDPITQRHAALLTRMEMLTSGSQNKLTSFKSAVRQFKNSESGAQDLVDTVFNVLDRDADSTAGVIREIASLFESEGEKDKTTGLLSALNAFRIEQREQFPTLPSGPSGLGTNFAGITSGAILNAKRSTQTHRRGGSSVWDRVEAAAASQPVNRPPTTTGGRFIPGSGISPANTAVFPTLGGPTNTAGPSRTTTHSTPWAKGGAGSSSKAPSALASGSMISSTPAASASVRTIATKSRGGSGPAPALNKAAFPSLPTTAKSAAEDRKALLKKNSARDEYIRKMTGGAPPPPINGWTGATNGSGAADEVTQGVEGISMEDAAPGGALAVGGGGKKKGKQKQLLFAVSARPS